MTFTNTDSTEKRARFDYCLVGMQVHDQIKEIQRKLQQEIK